MLVFTRNSDIQNTLANDKRLSKSIGFVPTMGALHDGHIHLVKKALEVCDCVVVSIFVNPRQFNNANDLAMYPRTLENDISLLEKVDCHYLYAPDESEVYQNEGIQDWDFGNLMKTMEGEHRPGHFNGMLTVVHQLLSIIQPHHLFMGEKDFQQAALVRCLLSSHHKDIEFHLVNTVREPDGLAMSSRNVLLSLNERKLAMMIPSALKKLAACSDLTSCVQAITSVSEELISSGIKVDYLQLRNEVDLSAITNVDGAKRCRLFFAGYVGRVRLIDNMALHF
ncbi:MAG: pantoate--beta-alanine ligase [Flavobacteriales bacterium]